MAGKLAALLSRTSRSNAGLTRHSFFCERVPQILDLKDSEIRNGVDVATLHRTYMFWDESAR